MYLEFDNFSYVHNVYFHASWPPTRRTRPDRIPVVCFEIVGLFDHESPLTLTVWTQIRPEILIRFQTARNYYVCIHELGPGPRQEIYF